MARLLPDDPENLGSQVFRSSGPIRSAPKVTIDTVVDRRMSGQEPVFPLQIHTLPHRLQAHALIMSGSHQTVTRILENFETAKTG